MALWAPWVLSVFKPLCPNSNLPVAQFTFSYRHSSPQVVSCYKCHGVNGDGAMPINRLLRDGELKPEEIDKLNRAYTYALRELSLVDRNDPLTEMLARKIIEVGTTESDPAKISEIALMRLRM